MNLSLREKQELKKIIGDLCDRDYEIIDNETLRLASSYSALINLLQDYNPDENTRDAIEWLSEEDCEFQDKAAAIFFNLIRERVKTEYALNTFKCNHTFREIP